jgi:YaiO family outer membrane protein
MFAILAAATALPVQAQGSTANDIQGLSAAVRARPNDVDARLKLGLVLAAARQWTLAEQEFRQVIARAPTYWDAHIALARIAYWRGDLDEAERRLVPVQAVAPEPAEAVALREQIAAARRDIPGRWRLDLSSSHSELSRGLEPWREVNASLSRPLSGKQNYLVGTVHAAERFARTDVYLESLYSHAFGTGGDAYLAIGGTPDADFLPRAQVRAGVTAPLNDRGLSGGAHLALAKFSTEESTSLRGVLRQSLLDDRFAVSGSLVHVLTDSGRSLSGYEVQGEAALSSRARLTLGYSDAPESSDGTAVAVKAVSAGLRYDLTRGRAIRVSYIHEDRGAYKRDELALRATLRF